MSAFEKYVLVYLKAHFAGLGAAVSLLLTDLHGGHALGALTGNQWIAIAGVALGVGAVVGAVPNKTPDAPAVADAPVAQDVVDAAPSA